MSGLTSGAGHKRSICEVHRELYDLAHAHLRDPYTLQVFTDKLEEAYAMAKKMQAKLRQYKGNYDEGWWERQKEEIVQGKQTLRAERTLCKRSKLRTTCASALPSAAGCAKSTSHQEDAARLMIS